MDSFRYYSPTEIVFGRQAQEKTGELIKKYNGSKVLIVYGSGSVVRSGLLDEVKKILEKDGILYVEHGGVKPNPRLDFAREGVKKAIEAGVDFVLAIGGGSAIDTGKAVAVGAANPKTDIWSFWMDEEVPKKALPVGVILTLAAAGSESSPSAVLTNTEIDRKKGLTSDLNRPRFGILNPELTFTLPKYPLACGITDIYMHTIERYFTKASGNEMTDEIAEGLMRNVIRNGKKAYRNPKDYQSMSEIMWSGSLSHNDLTGLGNGKDFAVHGIGHVLSALYDEAHGGTLSALWSSWAREVYQEDIDRFVQYGKRVFNIENENKEEAALEAIETTEQFFKSLDMPIRLTQLSKGKLEDEELRKMADISTFGDTKTLGVFCRIDAQKAYEIYKRANEEPGV